MIYHINPEKRTVCCRMPVHEDGHHRFLFEEARDQAIAKLCRYARGCSGGKYDFAWEIRGLVTPIFEKRMKGAEYYGIAHCHPNDEFDVEKGKEVARNKALMSYYKDMEHCMVEVAELFHNLHMLAEDKADECLEYEERLAIRQENF